MRFAVLITLLVAFAPASQSAWTGDIAWTLWSLPPDAKMTRWLEIHHLDTAHADGLYHVQVMGRNRGDPVWKYEHLADHLAITEAALRASIVSQLKSGSMYPESYDGGYQLWLKAQARGTAFVCTTNVLDCLAKAAPNNALERERGQ